MSLSKLHMNGIMTGHVNYFCFACEKHFKHDEDAHAHVDKRGHQKNMETVVYLDKFRGENIRKVKCGYYCEYCNLFLKTTTKVAMHVEEADHVNNKGYSAIKREDNCILVANKVLIGDAAWHGMSGDTCALCNTDIDDEEIHKHLPSHIVNLVGSKLEFGPNEIIYRRVDSTSFQCLTCNLVCALISLAQHSDSNDHKDKLKKHTVTQKGNIALQNDKATNGEGTKNEILNLLPVYQKNDVNIDFLTDTAFCKRCQQTMKLDINLLNEHLKQHGDQKVPLYPTSFDDKTHQLYLDAESEANGPGKVENDSVNNATDKNDKTSDNSAEANEAGPSEPKNLYKFVKDNHLTFNLGECNAYCKVCKVMLPSAMKSLTEHVNGKIHQKNVAYVAKSLEVVPKVSLELFVKSDIGFSGVFHDDMVINYKYCVTLASYHLVTLMTAGDCLGMRCNLCDAVMPVVFFLRQHIEEERHKSALFQTSVVTCMPDEFIREIRTGMYHCGYCNLLFQNWGQIKDHVRSQEHQEHKSVAKRRCREHMKDLSEYRDMQLLQLLFKRFG